GRKMHASVAWRISLRFVFYRDAGPAKKIQRVPRGLERDLEMFRDPAGCAHARHEEQDMDRGEIPGAVIDRLVFRAKRLLDADAFGDLAPSGADRLEPALMVLPESMGTRA